MGLKLTVFVIFLILTDSILSSSETIREEKSLFDDLPLNGAYSADPEGTEVEVSDEAPSLDQISSLSLEKIKGVVKALSKTNSLFDSLPNQGAMKTKEHIFESKTQKRGIFATDTELLQSPNGHLRFQIELQRQAPNTEFNLQNFHTNQLPSIVKHIVTENSAQVQPLIPIVHGNTLRVNPVSTLYGTPVNPTPVRTYPVQNSNIIADVRKPGSTVIVHGIPVGNLKKSESEPKEIHNHFYPTRQEVRNHYHHSRGRQQRRGYGSRQKVGGEGRTPIPILFGPSTNDRGYGPDTGNQNIDFTTSAPIPIVPTTQTPITSTFTPSEGDYDYDTLQDIPKKEGYISSRVGLLRQNYDTYSNEPATSYRAPSEDSKSYYYNDRQPLDMYGPPSAPAPSYGPPSRPNQNPTLPPPPPSYGPPRIPEQIPAPPPSATSTTSISYQTIPIQTVQTQLVTVPQITVSSSSAVESDSTGDIRPQAPQRPQRPSGGYGLPLGNTQDSPARGGLPSGSLFTDDQIELLLSASRGFGTEGQYDDDTLSISSAVPRGGGNILNLNPELGNFQFSSLGGTRLRNNHQNLFNTPFQLPLRTTGLRNTGLGNTGLNQNQLITLLAHQQQQQQRYASFQNTELGLLNGGTRNGPLLTGDAVDAVSDILREQRLRGAVSDLQGRLRHEGRSADRARRNYRSLFYKGALLLGALTLLPTVATPLAAVASGIRSPHFLLPLASGRRKREILSDPNFDLMAPFELCKTSLKSIKGREGIRIAEYLSCINNTTEHSPDSSMFTTMSFNGAIIPEEIRSDLQKSLTPTEIIKNSECLQKQFCETLIEIQGLPNAETFLFLYAAFASDVETNPWIREAMTAARANHCAVFYCSEDYSITMNTKSTAS